MIYILPRALIVLVAWGITCALIKNVWWGADPMIFYAAGASWALAGVVGFGYLRRLRQDDHQGHRGY